MTQSIKTETRSAQFADSADWPRDHQVVIVAPFPPPFGGMAVQAEQLKNLLESCSVPVTTIATNWNTAGCWSFVESLPGFRTMVHLIHFINRVFSIASPKTVFHVFSNSFASFFLWTFTTVMIGSWRKSTVLINYRGGHAEEFLRRWKILVLPVLRKARGVIVPSRFLEYVFLRNGISTTVIPNIIADQVKSRKNGANKPANVVVNRNFEPIYNVSCAIRAFALIQAAYPEASLTLIGDGSQRRQLEKLVAQFGLRQVVFTGQIANHRVIELLHSADILLNPTTVDNMPISLLEAMVLGVPIVSSNVGGVPYLIEHEVNGLLVGVNDHRAMAAAALRIMKSPSLRKRLVENSVAMSDEYRWEKVWPMWRSVYSTLQNLR